MKRFSKIFFAVAALFAFACTTDATQDLGVDLGGQTSLALSLEESRTQLGEKAEGLYPLTWSAGDAVALNGVASTALTAEEAGGAGALFTFDGTLARPFNIVYPAPAEGVEALTEGQYPVVFPANQAYTAGTFANGVAPMYGYAAEGTEGAIQLNHLTGVLRLAVKGEGVTLRTLSIEAESGKLSGTYDVDCATGALTAHDDASSIVVVTFGEGLKLGAEATPIYVAVPAGTYGKISLVLNSTTDRMTLAFDTTSKPIAAGTVREFAEFTYTANATDSEIYLIDSKETLIQFASIAANFAPYKEAKVVAPIDMTGVEWTPIEGFGFVFNGNNQIIKGLTAPLFGTTKAAIKNLTLSDVNITSNGMLRVGAIACTLINDGFSGATVSNCSVSGKITIANPDYTPATPAEGDVLCDIVNCGGLVGLSQGGVICNCVNEATIQVNQVAKAGHTVTLHPTIGGIVGATTRSELGTVVVSASILECENKGAINYHDCEETQILFPHVGGIVGLTDWVDAYEGTTSKCVNRGAIDLSANSNGSTSINWATAATVGGIAGSVYGYLTDCDNYGKITISGGNIKTLHAGGIAGTSIPRLISNCHNHTSGTITVEEDVRSWSMNIAGLVAGFVKSNNYAGEEVVDCSNDGALTVKSSTDEAITTGDYYYRVAGIFCYANTTNRNCVNKENGDITVSGNIILARANNQPCYGVCGTVAYHTTEGYTYGSVNHGDINVYTNVSVHTGITNTEYCKLNIGGLGGYHTRSLGEKAENYGNITIGKPGVAQSIAANGIYIGGIVSHSNSISCNPVNEGNITIHDKVSLSSGIEIMIGGMFGRMSSNISNATNKGNITINGTSQSAYLHVGGVVGYLLKDSGSYTITNCTNSGNIINNSVMTSGNTNGGIVGRCTRALIATDCSNSGDVTLNGKPTSNAYTAGIASFTAGLTATNCHNTGVMTVTKNAAAPKELYMGGITGYSNATSTFDNCSNSTKEGVEYGIVMSKEASATGGGNGLRLGGIFGRTSDVVTTQNGVTNSAGILVDGNQLGTAGLSIGGIGGIFAESAHQFKGLIHNSGLIHYKGRCPRCNFGFGGCFASPGTSAEVVYENIINTGDIIVENLYTDAFPNASGKSFQIGGVVANGASPLTNAQCFCKVKIINVLEAQATNSFGMLKGNLSTQTTITNSKFGGAICKSQTSHTQEEADGSSTTTVIDEYTPIDASNYLNYAYGDAITAEKAATDGIGFFTSIDEINYSVTAPAPEE